MMDKSAQEEKRSTKTIIVSTSVWKSFETGDRYTTVLKNISLEINQGEFVILFGPSGCGKSTFLNTLIGLEHPDEGNIKFKDIDIWTLDSDERAVIRKRNVGIIYQQQNWIKSLNVLDNVALIGSLLGYDKEKSEALSMKKLELVGMTHRADYKPYELSSGEQQRISLARSLMSDPSLIIADEPTGNLDVKNGLKVMDILKELSDNGKTIVMVTHNPEYFEFADRVLFMLDGEIKKNVKVTKKNVDDLKRKTIEDLEKFIGDGQTEKDKEKQKAPHPLHYQDDVRKRGKEKFLQIIDSIKFVMVFTLSMILLLLLYFPVYVLEYLFFKKSRLSEKISNLIIKIFNRLEGEGKKEQSSINSWDLGEISLSHLAEKKSRSIITILGVGVGIGFITFLLSLGYGLENLVINEVAEIEEMQQVNVNPIVGSEVVLDKERYEIINGIEGVAETYPLINVAATIFYEDSQTDIVAYGVEPEYLSVTKETFLGGENFEGEQQEIVISEDVLSMLAITDIDSIIEQTLELEFIPVDEEEEIISGQDEDVAGVYDDRVEYVVSGVVSDGSSPIMYFSINDAMNLGVSNYSETLVVLDESADMTSVRMEIETLGMETSSVIDTVSQIEQFFLYLRIGLAVFGIVAFVIAVLGMINTLTVSLMERTREVGLLKAVGMRSREVKKLFITESMLIAFFGGASGVILGSVMGLIVSLVLSGVSISKGGEYLFISKIPLYLIVSVIVVSVLIGFITGLYPSKRAVKMSPLDALRYE